MRSELERIARIEKYLMNRMPENEKIEFLNEMANNPDLKREVEETRQVLQSANYAGWKKEVNHGYNAYRKTKRLKQYAAVVIVTAGIAAAIWLWKTGSVDTEPQPDPHFLPEQNESGEKSWSHADAYLPAQYFEINTATDTVVVSEKGIILAIPAGFARHKDGSVVEGNVRISFKEALDAASIMMAGLSTRSGSQQLETGGMFYLNVQQSGENLDINPKKAIIAQVPADTLKPGMQLFKGERKQDGSIDWVNPEALNRELLTVPLNQLNFYPPEYLPALKNLGYDITNRTFTDSLYYAYDFEKVEFCDEESGKPEKGIYRDRHLVLNDLPVYGESVNEVRQNREDTVSVANYLLSDSGINSQTVYFGIDPSRIRSIWNKKFEKTLVATRQFEERLAVLHRFGLGKAVDYYVQNLEKPLAIIDAMIANNITDNSMRFAGKSAVQYFRDFAARGDGKVSMDRRLNAALQRFYKRTQRQFAEATSLARKNWEKDFRDAQKKEQNQQTTNITEAAKRNGKNFREELDLNMDEAYRQLGYPRPSPVVVTSRQSYTATVSSPGWKNIDRIVTEKTASRTTINDIDPKSGKRVVITYKSFSLQVKDFKKYEKLFVYLVPDKLSGFMTIEGNSGRYTEKHNELMTYNLVCIGFAKNEWFVYRQKNIQDGDMGEISLTTSSAGDLEHLLRKENTFGKVQEIMNTVSNEFLLMKYQRSVRKFNFTNTLRKKVADRTFLLCSAETVTIAGTPVPYGPCDK